MVEFCFPADFLKAWNRRNIFNTNTDAKERLNNLMQFLKKEVEGEDRISLAVAEFGLGKNQEYKSLKKKQFSSENLKNKVPTAMGLLTSTSNSDMKKSCIFCEGLWIKELENNKINLTDIGDSCEVIDILIGADVIGKMLTGRRKVLSSGLVAVETYLEWTLMGKVLQEGPSEENLAMTVLSLFVNEAEISNLWKLDLIGINDTVEKKSKYEIDLQTKKHFLETVTINEEGRYEVCLSWLAISHFCSIISTTTIPSVFDASARLANYPSLNQCLACGPNLIELIPDILLRFRKRKFGVIAGIRKAFLQIKILKADRDFLGFLWWEKIDEKKLRVFFDTQELSLE
ncbi:uncharacterized protein TNCV_3306271 [Trichonephila clavipes]|nr:uncharacterized protein TNCV_3306271 [Trichonephila clavipes]